MKTCFGFMFCGVALLALDFKFKEFDLAPNFVTGLGYALVAIGTGGLATMTWNFVIACTLGWLLVLGCVVGAYLVGEAEKAFAILMSVANCAMMWTTLAGVSDIATGRNRVDVAKRAKPLRWAYAGLIAASLVLGVTVQGTGPAVWLLTAIVVAAALVVMVFILHVLYRAWAELSP
jgi:hypothetical protein